MNQERLQLAVIVTLGFHACGLLLAPVGLESLRGDIAFYVYSGFVFGQICLLAGWASLSGEPWTQRVPRAWILFVLGWYAFLAGWLIVDDFFDTAMIATTGLFGATCFVMLQLCLRFSAPRGYVLQAAVDENRLSGTQFNLRQLIVWITAFGVLLAVGRFLVPTEKPNWAVVGPSAFYVGLYAATGVLDACLIGTPAFLIGSRQLTRNSIIRLVAVVLVVSGCCAGITATVTDVWRLAGFLEPVAVNTGIAGIIVANMQILRSNGLEWRIHRNENREESRFHGDSAKSVPENCR